MQDQKEGNSPPTVLWEGQITKRFVDVVALPTLGLKVTLICG